MARHVRRSRASRRHTGAANPPYLRGSSHADNSLVPTLRPRRVGRASRGARAGAAADHQGDRDDSGGGRECRRANAEWTNSDPRNCRQPRGVRSSDKATAPSSRETGTDDLAISPKGDRVAYSSATTTGDDYRLVDSYRSRTGASRGPAQRVSACAADTPSFSLQTGDHRHYHLARQGHRSRGHVGNRRSRADPCHDRSTGFRNSRGARTEHCVCSTADVHATRRIHHSATRRSAGKRADTVMTFPLQRGSGRLAPGFDCILRGRMRALWRMDASPTSRRPEHVENSRVPPGSIPDFSGQSARTTLSTATRLGAIHLLDIATGTTRTITAPSIVPSSIRWSLDGRRFAALLADATLRPHGGVIVMNADGSGQRQYDVPATGGLQLSPHWRHARLGDGKRRENRAAGPRDWTNTKPDWSGDVTHGNALAVGWEGDLRRGATPRRQECSPASRHRVDRAGRPVRSPA